MIQALFLALIGIFMLAGTSVGTLAVEKKFFTEQSQNTPPVVMVDEDIPPQNSPTLHAVTTATPPAATRSVNCVEDTWRNEADEDGEEDEDEDDEDEEERESRKSTNCTPTVSQVVATPASGSAAAVPSSAKSAAVLTMADVSAHNSAASCYSVISGSVYDLTSFVSRHPGGSAAIKSLCGVDGTAAYNNQHGGARRPASELAPLKIGTFAP